MRSAKLFLQREHCSVEVIIMPKKLTNKQLAAIHAKGQTARGIAQDKRKTAKNTLPATELNVTKWKRAPGKMDIKGVDTKTIKKRHWEMTLDEYKKDMGATPGEDELFKWTHYELVNQAISEGKNVPKNVKDGYPQFNKQYLQTPINIHIRGGTKTKKQKRRVLTEDEEREKYEKKRTRMRVQLTKVNAKIKTLKASQPDDYSFWTQPAIPGSSFAKQKERAIRDREELNRLSRKAAELKRQI